MVATAGAGSPSPEDDGATPRGYRHEAFFYRDDDEYFATLASFARDGVDRGEPVLVAVPDGRTHRFRDELGPASSEVTFVDMTAVGANPAHLIPFWQQFLDEHGHGRGIGEPAWVGRDDDSFHECARHEALLNFAFERETGFWLVCPYDASALDEGVVASAKATHPYLRRNGSVDASSDYVGVDACADFGNERLPRPPRDALVITFDMSRLRHIRRTVEAIATAAGLEAGRTADMVAAVNELTSNSIEHGTGAGRLELWREGDALVAQICDAGRLDDPLAGRRRPDRHDLEPSGRGLWLVFQLSDLVQMHRGHLGTTIRVRWNLPASEVTERV
jgi:anti-sigma regulatory factor (Ser/Thr protein kinase)